MLHAKWQTYLQFLVFSCQRKKTKPTNNRKLSWPLPHLAPTSHLHTTDVVHAEYYCRLMLDATLQTYVHFFWFSFWLSFLFLSKKPNKQTKNEGKLGWPFPCLAPTSSLHTTDVVQAQCYCRLVLHAKLQTYLHFFCLFLSCQMKKNTQKNQQKMTRNWADPFHA